MIYILGAGGMAKQTLVVYRDLNRFKHIAGFIEQNCKREGQKICGKSIFDASIIDTLDKNSIFISAIGSPKRKNWIETIEQRGFSFDTVIHPSAVVSDLASVDVGCVICPGVVITYGVKIGRHCIINAKSTIGHDSKIGNFTTICDGANIAGDVIVNDECWIGIGVTIINNVTIGKGSFIGAGAVVTKDIPENVLAVGVPAKPIRELTESDWRELI